MSPQAPDFPTIRRRDRPKRVRWAARIGYDGAGFHGFQRQPEQRTVEGELIAALMGLGLTGGLSFASRTDSGVHAEGQVVAFKADAGDTAETLAPRLSSLLPPDLRLLALRPAPPRFHPRWSAIGKRYRYTLATTAVSRSWCIERLDGARLEAALEALRGAPALDGFTAAGAPPKAAPPLTSLTIEGSDPPWTLTFEGPAFRRYAIRHMVGAIVACASGAIEVAALSAIATSPPPYRGLRAPADGLVLERVDYPPALDPFA